VVSCAVRVAEECFNPSASNRAISHPLVEVIHEISLARWWQRIQGVHHVRHVRVQARVPGGLCAGVREEVLQAPLLASGNRLRTIAVGRLQIDFDVLYFDVL
jgi:hypothetical protein